MKYGEKYRRTYLRERLRTEAAVKRAFIRVSNEFARKFANHPIIRHGEGFMFTANRKLNVEFTAMMDGFKTELFEIVKGGMERSWETANDMNDEMVIHYFKGLEEFKARQAAMMARNTAAMEAFIRRQRNGLKLSDRIWKIGDRYRNELEANLLVGISEGKSAAAIAEQIETYLKNPDKVFRRVRDAEGDLRLSNAAKLFHPGQGVYRSSYKNALRLTRTETNMAYRYADNLRWQKQDFILGYDVTLSFQHPFIDICDTLEGRYPKEFLFTGWHPNCFCFVTPVRMEKEDFIRHLNGEDVKVHRVRELPPEAKKWLAENREAVGKMKNKPYFIQDNAKYIRKATNIKF
jgi:hypothetical protein